VSDHRHLFHFGADGRVRCAFQDCAAEPTPEQAAEAIADAETRAAMRVEFAFATDWNRAK
jgi:hypothetical protein